MKLLTHACTVAALTSAAMAGKIVEVAAKGPTPTPAPAPGPSHAHLCSSRGNVTAWKANNGDQAPGLGAAFLPHDYKAGNATAGYICNVGNCKAVNVVPPMPYSTPAEYLKIDPDYGYRALDNDLQSFATLQNFESGKNVTDACFAYNLGRAFAGELVFASIANNSDVSANTSAVFLQSFFSEVPKLEQSLKQFPEQAPFYYHLITGYRGHCSSVLGDYIGSSQGPA